MAVFTRNEVPNSLTYWGDVDIASFGTVTSTQVIAFNTDGTLTILTGTGFTAAGGHLTGGTVTSMSRTDSTQTTVYETITGLSYAATTLDGHMPESNLEGVANDIFAGADTFNGYSGNDFFRGNAGNDTYNGGAGTGDLISYGQSTGPITVVMDTTSTVTGGASVGTDTLNNVEEVRGTSAADTYTATANFNGSGGTFNWFEGQGGNDTITGNGNTRLAYTQATAGVTFAWTSGTTTYAGTATGNSSVGTDTFTGVNAVEGSSSADILSAAGAIGFFNFIGGAGNDTITGGGVRFHFVGNNFDGNQARYDFATGAITASLGATETVTGNSSVGTDTLTGVEIIRGTSFADTFTATTDFSGIYGTFNQFEGGPGDDTITGNGNTRIRYNNATAGVTVDLANGVATGDSSVGTDHFAGVDGNGAALVNGVNGSNFDDILTAAGGRGNFTFVGGPGNDTITGTTEGINNFDSNTAYYTGATSGVTINLGATSMVTGDSSVGTDTLTNVERIRGSSFNDTFTATSAFQGQYGNLNSFEGGGGDDTVNGSGTTEVSYQNAMAGVTVNLQTGTAHGTAPLDVAGVGNDTFTGGVNRVIGSTFNDTITGSNGPQAEMFRGLDGNDTIDGGGGSMNVASYHNAPSGAVVDLSAHTAQDGYGTTDTLTNIQDVQGSEFNDTITGDSGDNGLVGENGDDHLIGGGGNDILVGDDDFSPWGTALGTKTAFDSGNDILEGGDGNDTLIGGPGNDTLTGGAGNDIFRFTHPSDGLETITDFLSGSDQIALDHTGFGLGGTGSLQAAGVNFVLGSIAPTSGPTVLYSHNVFYYDADGTGAGAAVALANVGGTSASDLVVTTPTLAGGSVVATGDFNGDGTTDILWQQSNHQLSQWLMQNTGILSQTNVGSTGSSGEWHAIVTGDFNNDGHTDLLWENTNTGQLYQWLMGSNGPSSQTALGSAAGGWSLLASGDFNGDHKTDLLWQHAGDGQLVEWTMNGSSITSQATLGSSAGGWGVLAQGDFNHDGTSDFIWENASSGQLVEWQMGASGIASQSTLGSAAGGWNVIAQADFNGDGTPDLLWENASTGQLVEWQMGGSGVSSQTGLGSAAGGWNILTQGDFNGDGKIDLLWENASTGQLVEWVMGASGVASQTSVGTAAGGWNVIAQGDFNADGTTDLLWQQNSSGTVYEWLMGGNGIAAQQALAPPAAGAQLVAHGDFNNDGTTDLVWQAPDGSTSTWLFSHAFAQDWIVA